MFIPSPKVASKTAPSIIALCERLVQKGESLYLDVEVINETIENECYKNVESMIKNKGGLIQYGWRIWETFPNLMAEAEFHAVWVDEKGIFHDITPISLPGINQILFLPDSSRKYLGKQIDNVRIPLQDETLIKQFIKNAEELFEVTNRGELAEYHGEIIATPEMKNLIKNKNEIFINIVQKFYS